MRISDITGILYKAYYFKYLSGKHNYPRLQMKKSQYTYRLLYVIDGKFNIVIDNERITCEAGDVVYLVPGEIYSIELCGCDFSIYNLFFGHSTDKKYIDSKNTACVFLHDYNPESSLEVLNFADADKLNKSGVFKGIYCFEELDSLMKNDSSEPYYDFHGKCAILSVISKILACKKQNGERNAKVDSLISYIRMHPDKNLSASELSRIFSYHKNYLNALVKQKTGKTLIEYVRRVKIEYAKSLISDGAMTLTQIAVTLGYYDYSHFYKAFLLESGLSPTEYQNIYR